MSYGNGIVLLIAQAGPTELFLPEVGIAEGGSFGWLAWGGGIAALVLVWVWMRAMGQRREDPRELAFRALSKRLKLSHKQVASIRAMGVSSGQDPVGLLMSPSAVRAAGQE